VKGGGTFDFGPIHLVAMTAPSPSPTSTAEAKYNADPSPSPSSTAFAKFYPSPSVAPSPTVPTRDLRTEIEKFVYEHLRKSVNADISGMLADYADRVDFFENSYADHSFIAKDRQTFVAGWPTLRISALSTVRISETANSNRVTIWFDYHFDARNSKGIHSTGDAANTWILDTSYGGLKIVSEKQNVTNRKRTR
jgi:hypothetical protein